MKYNIYCHSPRGFNYWHANKNYWGEKTPTVNYTLSKCRFIMIYMHNLGYWSANSKISPKIEIKNI